MKKLDLGCGPHTKLEGAIGLDMRAAPHVDVVHDLNDTPYPFEDDTFDHVEMFHIIEHLDRPLDTMAEVHRIARPGATVRIITPHYSSQLSYGDLEHHHHLGYITFQTLQGTGLFTIVKHKLWFLAGQPLAAALGKVPRLRLPGAVRGGVAADREAGRAGQPVAGGGVHVLGVRNPRPATRIRGRRTKPHYRPPSPGIPG